LLAEGGGEQEFAEVVGENFDRVGVGLRLGGEAELGLHSGGEQTCVGVGDGEAGLGGAAGGGALEEEAFGFGAGEGLGHGDAHHEEEFLLAATHGEQAVGGALGEGLGPLEVVFELGGLGFLAGEDFGGDDGGFLVELAEFLAGGGVVGDAFGEDVAGTG